MIQEKIINRGKEGIQVKYEISYLSGNSHGHFSITASIGEMKSGRKMDPIEICGTEMEMKSGGMMHEEIIKHFPDMADLIALHLSDENGVPMYAVENGHYHLGNLGTCAHYMRVTEDELIAALKERGISNKDNFAKWVETLKPRWKKEADAAILKYGLIVIPNWTKKK